MNDNNNEFIFNMHAGNHELYNVIETMLEDIQNNINIINNENNDYIEFDIELEFMTPMSNNIEEHIDYFRSCKEIDEKLCKSEKIKIKDDLLNESCFICMENYKINELKRKLPSCNHCFHKKCIDKWLKKRASCPVCRNNLLN